MNVAVRREYKTNRKEPLGDLVRRIAAMFDHAGVEPTVVATFGDTPGGIRSTSAVARAIKKYTHLAHLERNDPRWKGLHSRQFAV
jgi:hypothetical protein